MSEDLKTYEDLAEMLGTTKDMLYSTASKNPEVFAPSQTEGSLFLFNDEAVQRIRSWWDEHSRFRVSVNPPNERAYSAIELERELQIPFSTVNYYRRRHGMLYPDYYAPNPSKDGRGRPVSMYLQSTIDEWQRWVEAGRPEPAYARIKSVEFNQGHFEAVVQFGDGTVAGLINGEWRLSPPAEDAEEMARYIKFAARQVERKRYAQKWKRKE